MTDQDKGSSPLDDVRTSGGLQGGPTADSPKRHGDKFGTGTAAEATASELGREGDSPKRQGDPLEHVVKTAAEG